MKKLSYLWDFDSNFLKSTSYESLKHEICLQLIKLTTDLLNNIEYENRTFMSKIIVPTESISRWRDLSAKINSLAPNCDLIARKMNSVHSSKISKSGSYYHDFSVNRDSLLTKISVLIIELSSSAEAFQKVHMDLKKRLKKSIFDEGEMVPGKIVSRKLLTKLKNQKMVLQKIFSASKNLDMDYNKNQKLMDCQWMLEIIMKDRLLNSILSRDEIIDKILIKLRELYKHAFSVYEDKVNEQILGEEGKKDCTESFKNIESKLQTGEKKKKKDNWYKEIMKEEDKRRMQTEDEGSNRLTQGGNNMSSESTLFPVALSRINKGKQILEDNQSFMEDIEQLENTILKSPEDFYDSNISNINEHLTLKGKSKFRPTRERRKKKTKKEKMKKILNDKKIMEFLDMEQLTHNESCLSEDRKFYFSHIIGSNNDKMEKKTSETETETEYDYEDGDSRVKKVIYRNQIGNIDQKISVSNFNCSCKIF